MKRSAFLLWKRKRLDFDDGRNHGSLGSYIREWYYRYLHFMRRDKLERELFHSCVILKNLAMIHQELPMSADFLLEQLMEASKPLRNVYTDILSLYRQGEKDAAFRIIYQRIPAKSALDFARILSKLDYIEPSELVLQMDGFEETFSAERKTKAMARAERKSLITTLTSTATVFVVLLNFTVVVIFLDTLRILGQLF